MKQIANQSLTVVTERELPHPPEKVWRAITQPYLIEEWLMKNDFHAAVGHRFQLRGQWGGVLDCEVLAIEPNRLLSYSWNHPHADDAYNVNSVVTFSLTPTPVGTLLRVEQAGFHPSQKQAFGGAKAGWRQFLDRLASVLVLPVGETVDPLLSGDGSNP
jgi:uncharacterized protein YndB with AHSA1/START domain